MGLGAVNAAPCVLGRRSARGAVNKRPQAAARANHRRHSAPLRAPHRLGAIHYATRSAPAPRTQAFFARKQAADFDWRAPQGAAAALRVAGLAPALVAVFP